MGSFLNMAKAGLDPAGTILGKVAGPNSFIAKEAHYLPGGGTGLQKATAPDLYNAGQAYGNRNKVEAGPAPYAGVNPTLGDSLAGYQPAANGTPAISTPTAKSQAYVQQAQKAMQQQRPQQGQAGWGNGSYGGMSF